MSTLHTYLGEQRQEGAYSMGWLPTKTNWNSNDYYHFEDLARVENNISVLVKLVGLYGFYPELVEGELEDFPFADILNRIEGNIKMLGTRYKPKGWIEPFTEWVYGMSFSYIDANRLENNISLLYNHYKGNTANFKYCGAYIVGGDMI